MQCRIYSNIAERRASAQPKSEKQGTETNDRFGSAGARRPGCSRRGGKRGAKGNSLASFCEMRLRESSPDPFDRCAERGVLSAERPRYRRMPASDRPPHGAELSCRQRSATPDGRHGTSSGCFGERSLLRESFRRKSIPSAPRVPVHAGTRRSFPETPVAGSNNFRAKSLHRPKKRITFAHRFAKFRLCGRNGGCSSVG